MTETVLCILHISSTDSAKVGEKDGVTILEADLSYERKIPGYVTLDLEKEV